MADQNRTCRTCPAWNKTDAEMGECRCAPPRPNPNTSAQFGVVTALWPVTYDEHWCYYARYEMP